MIIYSMNCQVFDNDCRVGKWMLNDSIERIMWIDCIDIMGDNMIMMTTMIDQYYYNEWRMDDSCMHEMIEMTEMIENMY